MRNVISTLVVTVIVLIAVGVFYYLIDNNELPVEKATGLATSKLISNQTDWETGTLDNVDSVSEPHSIKIDNMEHTVIDMASIYSENPDAVTVSHLEEDKGKPLDGRNGPDYSWRPFPPNDEWSVWVIDLGQSHLVNRANSNIWGAVQPCVYVSESNITCDASGCTGANMGHGGVADDMPPLDDDTIPWWKVNFSATNARYVAFWQIDDGNIDEVSLWGPPTATHTSSPTQITHNDLYEWETFTPNYTKPENTNIEFRFKTSKDSESWTDWTSYQTPASGSPLDISSLVTSREGELGEEDFYKYFQVQTRLTSTDGVSTPTLSDYSVGYHTNKPPDKPVAGTVTIGQ